MHAARPLRRLGRAPVLVALLLLLGTAGPASAADGKGEYVGAWSASVLAGVALPTADSYGTALAWRVAGGYSPVPQVEVDLELAGFSSGVSQPDPNGIPLHTIASGNLDVKSVAFTVQWRPPQPEAFATAYALAGAGWYDVGYTMGDAQAAIFAASGAAGLPDQTVKGAWGFHLGAGVEYNLTESLLLVAEGRYLFLSPKSSGTAAPGRSIDGSIGLDTWLLLAGIKVVF